MARKTKRKPPKQFDVPYIEGPFGVWPLSALRYGEIEDRFPVDAKTKQRANAYAFFSAVMAAVITESATDRTLLYTETEMQTEFDADDFWNLWDVVGGYIGMTDKEKKPEGDPGKNSPSANGSPSASLVS